MTTTHAGPTITPPPSLDAILATSAKDERIGRVDFTAPLVTDVVEEDGAAPAPVAPEPVTEAEPEPVADADADAEPVAEPEPVTEPEAVAAPEPLTEPEAEAVAEPEPVTDPAPLPEPEPQPEPEPEQELLTDPADVPLPAPLPVDFLADELPHLAASVEEVAATVIDRMQRAGEAHVRHLEAVELETARRCELVTAQAELDAELIRLHARREAHAIITAARMRTGGAEGPAAEGRLLSEINTSLSRFAESIETSVAEASEAHDLPSPS